MHLAPPNPNFNFVGNLQPLWRATSHKPSHKRFTFNRIEAGQGHKLAFRGPFFTHGGRGFGVGIIVARVYGPEGYGNLSYEVAVSSSVFGSLASLGFDDLLPRGIAASEHNVNRRDAEKTALILRIAAELISYMLLLGFVWTEQGLGSVFWITAVYGGLFSPSYKM